MSDDSEIVDTGTEQEILYQRICAEVSGIARHALNPALTVKDHIEPITALILAGVLRQLRVMSGRQLAVLLAQAADRHAGFVISEPARYTASEIADVR